MREIRQSGSEGGGTGNSTGPPYPYHSWAPPEPSRRRISAQHVTLVVFDPVFLEQADQLVLERDPRVVDLLILDISPNLSHLRLADRERAISDLPSEASLRTSRFVDPFGRSRFGQSHHRRHRHVTLEFRQEMHVIGHTPHFQEHAAFAAD